MDGSFILDIEATRFNQFCLHFFHVLALHIQMYNNNEYHLRTLSSLSGKKRHDTREKKIFHPALTESITINEKRKPFYPSPHTFADNVVTIVACAERKKKKKAM